MSNSPWMCWPCHVLLYCSAPRIGASVEEGITETQQLLQASQVLITLCVIRWCRNHACPRGHQHLQRHDSGLVIVLSAVAAAAVGVFAGWSACDCCLVSLIMSCMAVAGRGLLCLQMRHFQPAADGQRNKMLLASICVRMPRLHVCALQAHLLEAQEKLRVANVELQELRAQSNTLAGQEKQALSASLRAAQKVQLLQVRADLGAEDEQNDLYPYVPVYNQACIVCQTVMLHKDACMLGQ